jgi:hypothetical protein
MLARAMAQAKGPVAHGAASGAPGSRTFMPISARPFFASPTLWSSFPTVGWALYLSTNCPISLR